MVIFRRVTIINIKGGVMKVKVITVIWFMLSLIATAQQKNAFYVKPLSQEDYLQWDEQTDEFYRLESEKKYDEMLNLAKEIIDQFPFIETGYYCRYYTGILNKDFRTVEDGLNGMVDKYFFSLNVYQNLFTAADGVDDESFRSEVEKALHGFLKKREAFLEEQSSNHINLGRIYKELTWINYQAADEEDFLRYLDKVMEYDFLFINPFRNREEWKENRFKSFRSERFKNMQKWNNTLEEKMKVLIILSNAMEYENASLHFAPIIDWSNHVANYLPRVIAAQTKQEFYEILAEMVGCVGEHHTNVGFPRDIRDAYSGCGIGITYGSGRFIVKSLRNEALTEKIKPGDIIMSVDGIPAYEYIEKNKNGFPFVSYYFLKSKAYKMWEFARRLLVGKRDSKVAVEFKRPSGETYSLELVRDSYKLSQSGSGDTEQLVELKILDGNIWYFNIKRFYGGDIYQQFLDLIKDTNTEEARGLIFDIRENQGGNSAHGDRIFSHLITQPAKRYFHGYHPVRIPLQEFRGYGYLALNRGGYPQEPSEAQKFDCPIVVLISPQTGSAAEDFADLFKHNKRGQLVGLPTGGGTGNGHNVYLPGGGSIRVCLNVDLGFSWVGVQPDHRIDFTPEDIDAGRDPQLNKAIELLKNE